MSRRSQSHLIELYGVDSSGYSPDQALNLLSNPEATGGASGTPGSAPTSYGVGDSQAIGYSQIVGQILQGIRIWEVHPAGTIDADGKPFEVFFEQPLFNTVLVGEQIRFGVLMRLAAGAKPASIQATLRLNEWSAAPAFLTTDVSADFSGTFPSSGSIVNQRYQWDFTISNAACRTVTPSVLFNILTPGAANFSIQFGDPELIRL